METREHENMNTAPIRANTVKGFDCLEMNFGGDKYETQFTSTGKNRKYFMHGMHKLSVDV